ncbi:GCG_CRPN prefix-to-repeats domain-containing protein [Methylocystis echinoides]|uniref:GCG_CRPN prefix-to-repeats domain-containing protein n=1 Tax=Methylocystis echinoides TaxID=29468 RepID=UPI00386208EE
MKKLSAVLCAAILSASLSSVATPALALGGCGPNGHRNAWGYCVFGGQNQDWCLRRTGHPATRMPNGTLRCFR